MSWWQVVLTVWLGGNLVVITWLLLRYFVQSDWMFQRKIEADIRQIRRAQRKAQRGKTRQGRRYP